MKSVSGFVPVYEAVSRLPKLLLALQELCDEVVVVVDERSSDGSEEVARQFTRDVFRFSHDQHFTNMFEEMMRRCRGDWVLRFDDDELPSSNWTRDRVVALASDPGITNYHFPRRWLVPPGDRYCCQQPHWPNYAVRMMIRQRDLVLPPRAQMHGALTIHGKRRLLADLYIDHLNFLVYDRAERERKVAEYERAEAGAGLPEWYLYEDYGYQTDVVLAPSPMRGPAGAFGSPSTYCVDLRILHLPATIVAGQTYFADVEVVNRSIHEIAALPDDEVQPNRFASHWVSFDGSEQWFESPRTMIGNPIPPGASDRALIRIDAPPRPGQFWLRADIVEENVAWYSAAPGAGFHEPRFVEVVAKP